VSARGQGRWLGRKFFARPVLKVAPELIGKYLVHSTAAGAASGRIVEVEAYDGPEDQASHARFGPTPRAKIMFGPAGIAYVYLIYGMYDCFNVVTGREGEASAVLVRAVASVSLPTGPTGSAGRTDGPGKLCRALGITRAHNGVDLTLGVPLGIEDRGEPAPKLSATPRIGVDYAGEWAARPWRFIETPARDAASAPSAPRRRKS